jgi:hypothetical protein
MERRGKMKQLVKKTCIIVAAFTAAMPAFTADSNDVNAKILERLQALEALVKDQQAEIESMRQQLSDKAETRELIHGFVEEEVEVQLDDRLDADALAQIKDTATVALGSAVSGMSLTADLRLRAEQRERPDKDDDDRTRYRSRIRVGGKWVSEAENWEIGIGIATGGEDATSTNDTWSDKGPFDSGDARIDYGYVKHTWDNFSLTLGQQKNPWKDSTTEIMWDSDARPVGVTAKYDGDGLFLTGGVYNVFDSDGGSEAEALLLSTQLGFEFDNGMLAIGYWHYNDEAVDFVNGQASTSTEVVIDEGASVAAGAAGADGDFGTGDDDPTKLVYATKTTTSYDGDEGLGPAAAYSDDFEYQLFDVYGKVGTEIGAFDVTLYGHYVLNMGAEDGSLVGGEMADDNDQAYKIGVKAKAGKWELGYAWKHVEADAIFQPVTDSDFGSGIGFSSSTGAEGIDVEGHELKLKYKFSKSVSLSLEANLVEEIESGSDKAELYQLDLVYKF